MSNQFQQKIITAVLKIYREKLLKDQIFERPSVRGQLLRCLSLS